MPDVLLQNLILDDCCVKRQSFTQQTVSKEDLIIIIHKPHRIMKLDSEHLFDVFFSEQLQA